MSIRDGTVLARDACQALSSCWLTGSQHLSGEGRSGGVSQFVSFWSSLICSGMSSYCDLPIVATGEEEKESDKEPHGV